MKYFFQFFHKLTNFFRYLKFQKKLLLSYSVLIVLFLVIAGFAIYYYAANTIRNEVVNYAQISVQQINKNIDNFIDELYRLSTMTFTDEKLQGILKNNGRIPATEQIKDDAYILNFLFNIYVFRPDLYSVYIVTNSGKTYIEGYNRYINVEYDVGKEEWYERLNESEQGALILGPRISTQTMGAKTEKSVFTIARRIITPEEEVLGTVILDTKYDSFRKLFQKFESEQNTQIIIQNDRDEVVFNSRSGQYLVSYPDGNSEIYFETENNIGERVVAITDKSSYTGWNVTMVVPEKQFMRKINSVRNFIILLILICITVSVLLSINISSALTGSVRKLTRLMKNVENGDFSVSMEIKSNDEIGELGKGFNNMISRVNLLLKKIIVSETKKKEAEIKALQSQINPHFLYNTLESIRMNCIVKKDFEIAGVINTLGNLFRLSIDRGDNFVPLKDELEHVQSYMSIQNFRYDNKYSLVIKAEEDYMEYKVPKLMLQPLVENCIYHGLEMKPGNGLIKIEVVLESRVMDILIEDDGLGMSEEKYKRLMGLLADNDEPDDQRGIGIKNVHERIRLYFGNEYGLSIWSMENKGTRIHIRLPAFKNKNEVSLYV